MASVKRYLVLALFCLHILPHASGKDAMGDEFFIAFPLSASSENVLTVYITSHANQSNFVRVESLRGYSSFFYVRAGETHVFNPPASFAILNKLDYNKGLWVHTLSSERTVSLSVMKHAATDMLTDSYLALPPVTYPNLQEYEFYVNSYYWNNRILTNYSSSIVVVGNKVNTSVTITPSQRVEIPPHFLSPGYPQSVLNAGESYTVLIQQMETLHLESIYDLTGTKIVSNKPLTVLGSHECADVPVGVQFCDYLVEQFSPTVTWGRVFLMTSLHSRLTGERYKITAMKSLTSITVRCVVEGESAPEVGHVTMLLNASGDVREFELGKDRYCSVIANKPIQVVQYSLGYALDNIGDPFMMAIPPIAQYSNNYTLTSPEGYNNHISITVPLRHYNSSKILLDGQRVSGWWPVYCSASTVCGYGVRVSVTAGTHVVRHVDVGAGIMVFLYGFEFHDGYGMIAGTNLNWIADVCKHGDVRLNPSSQTSDSLSGIVELCVDGTWTPICSEGWSTLEASVACTQLGHSQYGPLLGTGSLNITRWPTLGSDIRCLQSAQRLVECIHSWHETECPSAELSIRCYPRYAITVDIANATQHTTPNPAALVCQVTVNDTLTDGLSVQVTWSKDSVLLPQNTTQHAISGPRMLQPNGGSSTGVHVTRFESTLTVYALKPEDAGMYTCSARVVSSNSRVPLQALSDFTSSSVAVSVVESDNQLIQLRLIGVGRCGEWLNQHELPQEKGTQVSDAIIESLHCPGCDGITSRHITEPALMCFEQEATASTFRARIHATESVNITAIIEILRVWVSSEPTLRVGGVLLRVDYTCDVVLMSLSSGECGENMASFTRSTPPNPHRPSETTTNRGHTPTSEPPASTDHTHSSSGEISSPPQMIQPCDSSTYPLPTGDASGLGDMMVYVVTGCAMFVIIVVVMAIACVAVIVNCLKYRKTPTHNVISATSPFQMPLYDDPTPMSENVHKGEARENVYKERATWDKDLEAREHVDEAEAGEHGMYKAESGHVPKAETRTRRHMDKTGARGYVDKPEAHAHVPKAEARRHVHADKTGTHVHADKTGAHVHVDTAEACGHVHKELKTPENMYTKLEVLEHGHSETRPENIYAELKTDTGAVCDEVQHKEDFSSDSAKKQFMSSGV